MNPNRKATRAAALRELENVYRISAIVHCAEKTLRRAVEITGGASVELALVADDCGALQVGYAKRAAACRATLEENTR
ncbi:MAG: hypothetical protein A2W31_05150 [Planctomycetes bacterium RBG_16_64_10]|nr:MAG: hypothetical protein A2W31_05150 [Planctomycetes bacterium RBG_16_64_10]